MEVVIPRISINVSSDATDTTRGITKVNKTSADMTEKAKLYRIHANPTTYHYPSSSFYQGEYQDYQPKAPWQG